MPRFSAPFGKRSQTEYNSLTTQNLLTNRSHRFSEEPETQLRLYYDQYRRDSDAFGERINTYDVDFQHRLKLPFGNNVVWGLGYRLMSDTFRTSQTITMAKSARDLSLYSAFVQDEISLMQNQAFLTLGSKFLHNDFTGFEIQPSVRLLWTVTPEHSLWIPQSRAIRTPDRFHRDSTLTAATLPPFGAPIRIIGGPIVSERVISFELGYRGQLESRLGLDLAAFYNTYDRLVSSETVVNFPPTAQYANNLTGYTAGREGHRRSNCPGAFFHRQHRHRHCA